MYSGPYIFQSICYTATIQQRQHLRPPPQDIGQPSQQPITYRHKPPLHSNRQQYKAASMARGREYNTSLAGLVFLVATIAVIWASVSSSVKLASQHSALVRPREYVYSNNISARANDGNDRDPNFYPVGITEINATPNVALDPRGLSIKNGRMLECKMDRTLAEALDEQTKWDDYGDLDDYGWDFNIEANDEEIREKIQLDDAFADLGISNDPADWIKIIQWHGRQSEMDGYTYPATGASYKNIVNLKNGALVAQNNMSPRHEAEQRGELETTRMIPLDRWSDVVWLGIQQLAELGESKLSFSTPIA